MPRLLPLLGNIFTNAIRLHSQLNDLIKHQTNTREKEKLTRTLFPCAFTENSQWTEARTRARESVHELVKLSAHIDTRLHPWRSAESSSPSHTLEALHQPLAVVYKTSLTWGMNASSPWNERHLIYETFRDYSKEKSRRANTCQLYFSVARSVAYIPARSYRVRLVVRNGSAILCTRAIVRLLRVCKLTSCKRWL